MVDVQYELWKQELRQGKTIKIPVNSERLEPILSRGDRVEVKKVPMKGFQVNDVLFVEIAGKVGLRRISNVRELYGKSSIEITDEDGTIRQIPENAIMGKVIKMIRPNVAAAGPTPLEKTLSMIKRIIFPGTGG